MHTDSKHGVCQLISLVRSCACPDSCASAFHCDLTSHHVIEVVVFDLVHSAAAHSWHKERQTDRPCYIGSKRQHHIQGVQRCALATFIMLTHHRRRRVAGEGRRVVASPCPRSTARLQRSPIGRVESFRSWLSHLFCGRPGGRRHERSGGQLSDTLMWSWRAMFAGVTSSSRAACPNTEMSRRDRRWYCPLQ